MNLIGHNTKLMNQAVSEKTREARDVVITVLMTPTEVARLKRACELKYDQSQSAFGRVAILKEMTRVEAEHGITEEHEAA